MIRFVRVMELVDRQPKEVARIFYDGSRLWANPDNTLTRNLLKYSLTLRVDGKLREVKPEDGELFFSGLSREYRGAYMSITPPEELKREEPSRYVREMHENYLKERGD